MGKEVPNISASQARHISPWDLPRHWPRIARIYFARLQRGQIDIRVSDKRFWQMRSCGLNAWHDPSWDWWIRLHPESRLNAIRILRDFGDQRLIALKRRNYMPSLDYFERAEMFRQGRL